MNATGLYFVGWRGMESFFKKRNMVRVVLLEKEFGSRIGNAFEESKVRIH